MMRFVLFAITLCIQGASDVADDAEVPVGILPEEYFKTIHPDKVEAEKTAVKAMTPTEKAAWMKKEKIVCSLNAERSSRRQLFLIAWMCEEAPATTTTSLDWEEQQQQHVVTIKNVIDSEDSPRPAKKIATMHFPQSVIPEATTLMVYFIRHAESTWNRVKANPIQAYKLVKGICDAPLTDDGAASGVAQTLLWNNAQMKGTTIGVELLQKIDASAITFFSSPLQRTYETVSSMFNSLGGAQNTQTLHLIPALRETSTGPDAKSHVMGQCRNIQGLIPKKMNGKDAGSHQERTEKFLKQGHLVKRLKNYENYWKGLKFVEDANSEFDDYRSASSSPGVSYFEPFLNDLFTITQGEGKDFALVSTHSHWIRDFASHVNAGHFGPAPGGNWAHYATEEGKVLNAHVIRVQITKTAFGLVSSDGPYTFGAQIEEAPPSGTDILGFDGAENVQTNVRVAAPVSRMHVILFGFIVATISLCYLVWFLKSPSSHGDRLLADFDHI